MPNPSHPRSHGLVEGPHVVRVHHGLEGGLHVTQFVVGPQNLAKNLQNVDSRAFRRSSRNRCNPPAVGRVDGLHGLSHHVGPRRQ